MTAPRNSAPATRRRGPPRSQRQGVKADLGSETAAATRNTGHAGRRPAAAPVGAQPPSGSRRGLRRGRAAAKQSAATGNSTAPGGSAGEAPCAWPAYARSTEEAEAEALAAVSSLYDDELKPIGRILRKRVAERILDETGIVGCSVNLDLLPEVDAKQVRAVCDACEQLRVEEEEGGDWSAVFIDRPPTFVDVYNPADCYDEELWSGLRDHCESPAGQDMSLPGGRYACAQALIALQLPVLADFSLGRICHIVQLAISQKKILGYMNGAVVPYAKSQSMVKEQCALYGQPCAGNGSSQGSSSALPIAPLEVARKYMREILDAGNGEVPLSNVKRIFRSRYQLELSETSFGYSKLSELLQDVDFRDICTVELQGHGYMVIETRPKGNDGIVNLSLVDSLPASAMPPSAQMLAAPVSVAAAGYRAALFEDGPRRVPFCADEPLSLDDASALTEGAPMVLVPTPTASTGAAAPRWCLSPSKDTGDGFVKCSVQHTFLQYKVPQTPLPGPKRRSTSVPKDMGRSESPTVEDYSCAEMKLAPAGGHVLKLSDEGESTTDGSGSERLRALTSQTRSGSSSSIEPCVGTEATVDRFASQRPPDLASLGYGAMRAMDGEDEIGHVTPMGSESARRRVSFCPDEPLGLEEAGLFWGRTPGTTPLPSPALHAPAAASVRAVEGMQWQPLTPGTLSREGLGVHNTFLHIAPVLPTPVRTGAFRRTSSVPKDVGRSKDDDSELQQYLQGNSPRPRGICVSPKPSPKPSPLPALSPAFVPPSPALTASPLYNYSDPVQWRRSLLSSSPSPQPTSLDLASAISNEFVPSAGTFSTPPPAQPGSLCSAALQASKHGNPTGRVLRLGDHL